MTPAREDLYVDEHGFLIRFSWKDHLRRIFGTMFDPKLQIEMRIKKIKADYNRDHLYDS